MRRIISAKSGIALFLATGGFFAIKGLAADAVPSKAAPQVLDYPDFQKQVQPFFNNYCIQCHSASGAEPDIRFDGLSDKAALEKSMPTLEKAVNMLRAQKMPPKGEAQPTKEERDAVQSWLAAYTSGIDCSDPALRTPGRVTLHRLNRAEYNNTIRDMLAMDIKPANAFPADDAGYGFDNNGDVLSIAPILMEKYINAASVVMDKAMFSDPVIPPPVMRWEGATMEGTIPKSDPKAALTRGGGAPGGANFGRSMPFGRVFNYSGEVSADYDFPIDGEYVLRLRGYANGRANVQFKLDGQDVGKPVPLTEAQQNTKIYGPDKVKVTAGKHHVTVAFVNGATKEEYDVIAAAAAEAAAKAATQPAVAEAAPVVVDEDAAAAAPVRPQRAPQAAANPPAAAQDGDPAAVAAAVGGATPPATNPARQGGAQAQRGAAGARRGGAQARGGAAARGGARGGGAAGAGAKPTIGVVFVEVEGPLEVTPDRMPESYRRVMITHPSATVSKQQAAEQIIRNFASKAYRRPVMDDEMKSLMEMWAKYDGRGETFESSINTTLQAVLVSPYFLYRYERDPDSSDAGNVRTLDEYELANRLSYFLWSSMPDEELFALAAKGQLRTNLDAQVKRMMNDPKSVALVDNFAGQWLKLRMMEFVNPDAKTFPNFDDALRQAMITETRMFFLSIMQEDHSVLDFLDANYTFLNERLAKHYGIEGVTGDEFRRVQLTSKDRGGLLTQGSVLTLTSYPARTSPVQRGKWVLENLLDQAPPPPPPNVPALKDQGELKGTLRQRMEQHRANPACANCHEQMDAIGFGLENFDAIGAWRKDDGGAAIDPAGALPGGQSFKGPAELKQVIKAHQDDFSRALTSKLLTYSLGRGLEKFDKCTVDEIMDKMKQSDYKFSVLVNQIVHSDPFQKRAGK